MSEMAMYAVMLVQLIGICQEMGRTADTITPAQCRLKVLIIGYFVS